MSLYLSLPRSLFIYICLCLYVHVSMSLFMPIFTPFYVSQPRVISKPHFCIIPVIYIYIYIYISIYIYTYNIYIYKERPCPRHCSAFLGVRTRATEPPRWSWKSRPCSWTGWSSSWSWKNRPSGKNRFFFQEKPPALTSVSYESVRVRIPVRVGVQVRVKGEGEG